jgi:hypothetical protein
MFTYLMSWVWRGQPIISVFAHGYARRWDRRQRKFILAPQSACQLEDLTAEEVGQLLGGN